MDDVIYRQDAIDALTTECSWTIYDEHGQLTPNGKEILETLQAVPSAQKKGHWELAEDGWYCTACELYPPFNCDPEEKGIPYCPNCGADMRGEVDGENS